MKFNRLKASIDNNSGEQPSIYMALCLVESLFEDMEDEFGKELSECPAGDEGLSTKLVWLCRTINGVYEENNDELQRNRSRLDAAMERLKKTEQSLAELSNVAEQLAALRHEHSALENQLQAAQETKRQYETLAGQCTQARQLLENLHKFDPDVAKAELAALTNEVKKLEEDKKQLSDRLQDAAENANNLKQELQKLQAEDAEYQQQTRALTEQLNNTKALTKNVQQELISLEKQNETLSSELEQFTQQKTESLRKIEDLQQTVASYQNEQLSPVLSQLQALEQEIARFEQGKDKAEQECSQLANQRSELILAISRQKEAREIEQAKLKNTQDQLDKIKADKHELEKKVAIAVQTLDRLQGEVDHLATNKLTELKKLIEQETQRKEDLILQISDSEKEHARLVTEIQALESQLPDVEVNLKHNQEVYDALTANYTASTKELEGLERQIAELRDKNDQDKLSIYRKQLEDNLRELEAIRTECNNIQLENQRLASELESGQNERFRLLNLKQKHETGIEATRKQLRELEFAGTKEYAREVTILSQRLELLETVRGKLANSISKMRRALGKAPFEGDIPLEDQLKTELRDLRMRTDDLRCALLDCANNLKMEER